MLKEADMSIEGLGALTGMEEDRVWDIVSGASRPNKGLLGRIAYALGKQYQQPGLPADPGCRAGECQPFP